MKYAARSLPDFWCAAKSPTRPTHSRLGRRSSLVFSRRSKFDRLAVGAACWAVDAGVSLAAAVGAAFRARRPSEQLGGLSAQAFRSPRRRSSLVFCRRSGFACLGRRSSLLVCRRRRYGRLGRRSSSEEIIIDADINMLSGEGILYQRVCRLLGMMPNCNIPKFFKRRRQGMFINDPICKHQKACCAPCMCCTHSCTPTHTRIYAPWPSAGHLLRQRSAGGQTSKPAGIREARGGERVSEAEKWGL